MSKRTLPVILIALAACGGTPAVAPSSDDPGALIALYAGSAQTTLASSAYSGFRDSTRLVVRDRTAWTRVWSAINGAVEPMPPVPAVDFGEEMVIVAALGQRRSGGYAIQIDSVARHELGAVIYVTKSAPGRNCLTTQAITSPVHAVRVPRIEGRVAWRERATVATCG